MKPREQYKPQELPSCAIILNEDFPEVKEGELMQEVNKGKYVFYTQIDGDDGEVYYLKGVHNVNRTGIFALIPSTYRQASRRELETLIEKLLHGCERTKREEEILEDYR